MQDELDYDRELNDIVNQVDNILKYLISFLENKRKVGAGHGLLSEYEHLITKDILDLKKEVKIESEKENPDEDKLKILTESISEKSNLLREVKEVRDDIRREGVDKPLTRSRMKSILEDCHDHYEKFPSKNYSGFLSNSKRLGNATRLYLGLERKEEISSDKEKEPNEEIDEELKNELIRYGEKELIHDKDNSLHGEILPPTETTVTKYNKFNDIDIEVIYNAKFCLEQASERLLEDKRFLNTKGHIEITPLLNGPTTGLMIGASDYSAKVDKLHFLVETAKEKFGQKTLAFPQKKLIDIKNNILNEGIEQSMGKKQVQGAAINR